MTTTTSATAGAGTTPVQANGTSKVNQEYNSELFMKLLVTQLSNQDPSSPMDSSQMVAQTAQLASMEQLTSLNKTTTSNYQAQMQSTATSMLGKSVSWTGSGSSGSGRAFDRGDLPGGRAASAAADAPASPIRLPGRSSSLLDVLA